LRGDRQDSFLLQLFDRGRVGFVPVDVDHSRRLIFGSLQHLAEEALGGLRIPSGAEHKVNRLAESRARRKPPSQTWRTFLDNHFRELVSIDFLTVPTATFRVLYVLVVLAHDRRRVDHFNVTEDPTAAWTAQQIIEAFPEDTAPRFLLRDRDRIYG
jgi:putative transposase